MAYALIFGAGKQGRGILAYLCARNSLEPVFIDSDVKLIAQMKETQQYQITTLQDTCEKQIILPCSHCVHNDDIEEIASYFKDAKIIFTSASSKQIQHVAETISAVWMLLFDQQINCKKNIILCENGADKLERFRLGLFSNMSENAKQMAQECLGICEALSMSLAINPLGHEHDLAIIIQEQMRLFINKNQMKGDLIELVAVRYVDNFESLRKQALYTNNTSSAFVSYLGYLMGYKTLKEAMQNETIKTYLTTCYEEINLTLIKDLGVSPIDQKEFAEFARKKYENSEDEIDRHTREVIRKLGREERLTGICERAIKNGIVPKSISLGLASALCYRSEQDNESQELARLCETSTLQELLYKVCKIEPDDSLVELIRNHLHWLVDNQYLCQDKIVTKLIND